MPTLKSTRRQSGFTLVELLIVVIILAILAAIVIPQFSNATADAKEAALDSNLAGLRNAIELYKAQHGGKLPASTASTAATACTAGTVTGAVDSAAAFAGQLTAYSNAAGETCLAADPAYPYGPYIRKSIPTDPIKETNAVVVTNTGAAIVPSAATGGWAYDDKSGQIVVNSNAKDSKQVEYYKH